MRAFGLRSGWVVVCLLTAMPVAAQDNSLDELRERLDRVERQNRFLMEQLERQKKPLASVSRLDEGADSEIMSPGSKQLQTVLENPAPVPVPAEPDWYEVGSDKAMHARWQNGLEIETKNKDFRIHIGGRTQLDWSWFDVDDAVQADPTLANPFRDGVDFRRARLRADGTMYEVIDFEVEYDFVQGARVSTPGGGTLNEALTGPTDLHFTITKLPKIGNIRFGNHKEPIGFEHLTSSRYLNFMERTYMQDAFYGGFNNGFSVGASMFNTMLDDHARWQVGMFSPNSNVFAFNTGGAEVAVTGRLTGLLMYEDEGRNLVHVGVSGRHATLDDGLTRYRVRPAVRSGLSSVWPLPADTGSFNGDTQQWMNFELVSVLGPWTFQAEYLSAFIQDAFRTGSSSVGTVNYQGYYVEVLYFLTGEHRVYNRKNAAFDRVVPHENFFLVPGEDGSIFGRGGWQIGVRYDHLDLNDKGINGGRLDDVTLGLNWFLNPNMKVQWNYNVTHRDSPAGGAGDGMIHGFGMRVAHDF
jgi:phosphate-selective porin OprO/OprP